MVKHTVRFSEEVVDEIQELVDEGHFESKSEFHRFATDYVLDRIVDDYEPQTIDFDAITREVLPDTAVGAAGRERDEVPFFESFVLVRKYALRGNVSDAEDFIDHHYAPDDPHALMLEELLNSYRPEAPEEDTGPSRSPSPDRVR